MSIGMYVTVTCTPFVRMASSHSAGLPILTIGIGNVEYRMMSLPAGSMLHLSTGNRQPGATSLGSREVQSLLIEHHHTVLQHWLG